MGSNPLGLYLPAVVQQNMEREEMMVAQHISSALSLANELEALEPGRYEVWLAQENARPINGVHPGRWHIVRRNDKPAPDSYIPLTTESGGFREPNSGDIWKLQKRDTWKMRDPVPVKKEQKQDREGVIEELAHDIRAIDRLPGEGGVTKRLWGAGRKTNGKP